MSAAPPSGREQRRTISLERTYQANLEEVWDLWTTAAGLESWWGPEGFDVAVRHLDLRAGGTLRYTMTATEPAQVEFMQQAGMPLATDVSITYTDVEPRHRLGYTSLADFIPGLEPYEVATTVTLEPGPDGVHMVLTFEAMHDEDWTARAVAGHESELSQLDQILGASSN
jgi:uncharacterized protein YndB with AHSA1/START domain